MRFVLRFIQKVLVLAIFGLVVAGGHAIWVRLRERSPAQADVRSLASGISHATWLVVKDCEYTALEAVAWTNRLVHSYDEVLIPVRVDAHDTNSAIPLLIATRDPKIIEALHALQKADDFVAKLRTLADRPDLISVKRDVTGLVRIGLETTERESQTLRTAFPTLTANFIILNEGESPSAFKGVFMLGVAVFLLVAVGVIGLLTDRPPDRPSQTPPIIPPPVPPIIRRA